LLFNDRPRPCALSALTSIVSDRITAVSRRSRLAVPERDPGPEWTPSSLDRSLTTGQTYAY